jgi:carbonic anhydrase/acetyltransferase-like protein (isoleucine patch superfamily)
VHVDPGCPVSIGHDCIIGHLAIVHGATIGNHVLIGMNATILNHATIGDYCIIGANTLVPEGMNIPEGSLVVGTPARIIKQLDEEAKEKIRINADVYVELGKKYTSYTKSNN